MKKNPFEYKKRSIRPSFAFLWFVLFRDLEQFFDEIKECEIDEKLFFFFFFHKKYFSFRNNSK